MSTRVVIGHEPLAALARGILEAAGTPPDLAEIVAGSLVGANLAGHDSHGVMRLPAYVAMAREGLVVPAARAAVAQQHGATALVDGGWGWGQPACRLGARHAAELAAAHGVGSVAIGRANHAGRLGEYVEQLAREGLAALALCNVGPDVAPHGGRVARLGTNPLAFAAPRGDREEPFLVDFATSVLAEGKVALARARGERVAAGAILDRDGRPTRDPDDLYAGGSLLPFGGHKGYGLSVMIEILAGGLSGVGLSGLPGHRTGNGVLIVAFRVDAFQPYEWFVRQSELFHTKLVETPPAEGFTEVVAPGDPEARARRRHLVEGIDVPAATWAQLGGLAAELGVDMPAPVG